MGGSMHRAFVIRPSIRYFRVDGELGEFLPLPAVAIKNPGCDKEFPTVLVLGPL
jgi:hypothetical protein